MQPKLDRDQANEKESTKRGIKERKGANEQREEICDVQCYRMFDRDDTIDSRYTYYIYIDIYTYILYVYK